MDAPPVSRREQKKAEVREALVRAADQLFAELGYEGTTVDQIAERAGVSRRTFFRYFTSKEAIAFPRSEDRLETFRTLLRERFAEEPGLAAVRGACLQVARRFEAGRTEEVSRRKIIEGSPALLVAELELFRQWEKAVGDAVVRSDTDPARQQRGRLFAAAAIGILRCVMRNWYEADGRLDLVAATEEAFDRLETGFAGAF